MRLDHIAYRVKDRYKTTKFFEDVLGYTVGTEFQINFDDGSKADCLALEPPENRSESTDKWVYNVEGFERSVLDERCSDQNYPTNEVFHAPPEIFVSDGPMGSIVGDWVAARGGVGGIHHIAYQCADVANIMKEWQSKGYAEFLSEKPLVCTETNLIQVFTKPSELTGVIYELITRGNDNLGFCERNVKDLMLSTQEL